MAAALIAACCLSLRSGPLLAYDDDVHYAFTFFVARQVGYTALQAHRIASACLAIDDDSDTESVQGLQGTGPVLTLHPSEKVAGAQTQARLVLEGNTLKVRGRHGGEITALVDRRSDGRGDGGGTDPGDHRACISPETGRRQRGGSGPAANRPATGEDTRGLLLPGGGTR